MLLGHRDYKHVIWSMYVVMCFVYRLEKLEQLAARFEKKVCTYIHTCIHVHIVYTYVCIYVYACIYTFLCICMYCVY